MLISKLKNSTLRFKVPALSLNFSSPMIKMTISKLKVFTAKILNLLILKLKIYIKIKLYHNSKRTHICCPVWPSYRRFSDNNLPASYCFNNK